GPDDLAPEVGEQLDDLRSLALGDPCQHRLGPGVEHQVAQACRSHLAAQPRAGLQHGDAVVGRDEVTGRDQPAETTSDDGDPHRPWVVPGVVSGAPADSRASARSWGPSVCTSSTIRVSTSGSVSGGTPWPRLAMWPGAAVPERIMARTRSATTGHGAPRTAGSRLPCTGWLPPTRRDASARSMRQSTPMTSVM